MRVLAAGAAGAALILLVAVAVAVRRSPAPQEGVPASAAPPAAGSPASPEVLYGRVTTVDGATFEGRLRFGGTQEAFWGDIFNGVKRENPWAAHVPPGRLPTETYPIELFGMVLARRERPIELRRPFMARFGDLARIESSGRDVRVTFKGGSVVDLDRFEASDFDDGLRVWDDRRGVVDLDSLRIRAIDFLPTPAAGEIPSRLHGTVRTRRGAFTGFVRWNREDGLGSDELVGHNAEGDHRLRFDTLRSIARESSEGSRVTLRDGREIVLSSAGEIDLENRGVYVDDPRYGRVLVSTAAFERLDFHPSPGGPTYADFPPGRSLAGGVTTHSGVRLSGRLVFDLDESVTVETLDAPSEGVDYSLTFGLVASIVLPEGGGPARVTLHGGESIELERAGDLGPQNAGLLVFAEGREHPEYLPLGEVARVDLPAPDGGGPAGLR